jgi:catechol 2,3-dioxygenase-like lactoylglutathione lyase family enzyme
MPRMLIPSPCFLVRDVLASARWYRDQLGFQFSTWGEPAEFAIAFRDQLEIFLRQPKVDFAPRSARLVDTGGIDAFLRIDDVDGFAAELQGRGVTLTTAPITRFYKFRELEVTDPDGYLLCFAQDVA